MSTFTDVVPYYDSEFIVKELDRDISRKTITIKSGSGFVLPGTILGKITATGKYVPLDLDAENGSENPAAILVKRVDATDADVTTAQAIVRLATVNGGEISYPDGASDGDKTAIKAALDALMIVVLAAR